MCRLTWLDSNLSNNCNDLWVTSFKMFKAYTNNMFLNLVSTVFAMSITMWPLDSEAVENIIVYYYQTMLLLRSLFLKINNLILQTLWCAVRATCKDIHGLGKDHKKFLLDQVRFKNNVFLYKALSFRSFYSEGALYLLNPGQWLLTRSTEIITQYDLMQLPTLSALTGKYNKRPNGFS